MKKVGFSALVKESNVKSLVSGDKALRVVLEVWPIPRGLVGKLDELHSATKQVAVAIAEIEE